MTAYHRINNMTPERLEDAIAEAVSYQDEEFKFMLEAIHGSKHDLHITRHASDVALFAKLAGQVIPDTIGVPDEKTRILRAKLIMEEALETIRGLGVNIVSTSGLIINIDEFKGGKFTFCKDDFHDPNLKEIVDGCLDLRVVTTGALIACGVPDIEDLQECVDVNNITKFRKDKDGHLREDGKWVKPSDHPAPRIDAILKTLGWDGK